MEEEYEMSSPIARRKKSSVSLSCCFNGSNSSSSSNNNNNNNKKHRRRASFDTISSASSSSPIPFTSSPRRSPSNWIKSTDLPDKCRSLFSRMSRHRRHSSADFSYDPLSYALNFNDEDQAFDNDFYAKNFSSRLPLSPPSKTRDSHPPRMPRSLPDVYGKEDQESTPKAMAAGNDELRRGFEALTVSMRKSNNNAAKQRRVKGDLSTLRNMEVRRLEAHDQEVMSPAARIPSNHHEILIQLC